jgi:hypothetical protein
MAKDLEGLPLVFRTEEGVIKTIKLGLSDKFAGLLGVSPSSDN